jgi:hypothetical protein
VGANRGGTTPQSEKVLGEFDERAWRFLRDMSITRELEGAQLLATGARKASGQASGVLGAGAGKMGTSSSSIPSSAILPGGALHRSSVLGDPQRASVYLASSAATLEAFVAAMQDWYLRPRWVTTANSAAHSGQNRNRYPARKTPNPIPTQCSALLRTCTPVPWVSPFRGHACVIRECSRWLRTAWLHHVFDLLLPNAFPLAPTAPTALSSAPRSTSASPRRRWPVEGPSRQHPHCSC